ncbi:hypothetical protein ACQEUU_37125 [Nonomuraea sp. CA-218870]|uniref:hypothetical protein n=1 Tax=Nonomuraea sp. CA-218870 TaxID=3239998 RepID=UPI003D89E738
MPDLIGYVVIEYNQASRLPGLTDAPTLHTSEESAAVEMRGLAGEAAATGRRERYALAEVHLIEREGDGDVA